MAGVISTGNHPKLLWKGVHRIFQTEYEKHTRECAMVFAEFNSDKAYEEDVASAGFGLSVVKPEGSGISYDSHSQQGVSRYTHVVYGKGCKVTREEIEDNKYPQVAKARSSMLRDSQLQTEEVVCADVFNNGFANTGWDGVSLFSTSHPTVDDGSQSNTLATAADMTEASIEDLVVQIMNAKDNRGKRIALKPRKLIVPANLAFEAERIVKSVLQNDTANNAVNAIRSMGLFPDGPMVWHYLTDVDAWFIQTDLPADRGLKRFNRRPVELAQDNDFDTENACMKTTMRFSVSYSDWRAVYGSEGDS